MLYILRVIINTIVLIYFIGCPAAFAVPTVGLAGTSSQQPSSPTTWVNARAIGSYYAAHGHLVRSGNTLHQFFCGSQKNYVAGEGPEWNRTSGHGPDSVWYTSSGNNGLTWSSPIQLIKANLRQGPCTSTIVSQVISGTTYYYMIFEAYEDQSDEILALFAARSTSLSGPYAIYTNNGWQAQPTSAKWKPIYEPKVIRDGGRTSIASWKSGRCMDKKTTACNTWGAGWFETCSVNGTAKCCNSSDKPIGVDDDTIGGGNPFWGVGIPVLVQKPGGPVLIYYVDSTYDLLNNGSLKRYPCGNQATNSNYPLTLVNTVTFPGGVPTINPATETPTLDLNGNVTWLQASVHWMTQLGGGAYLALYYQGGSWSENMQWVVAKTSDDGIHWGNEQRVAWVDFRGGSTEAWEWGDVLRLEGDPNGVNTTLGPLKLSVTSSYDLFNPVMSSDRDKLPDGRNIPWTLFDSHQNIYGYTVTFDSGTWGNMIVPTDAERNVDPFNDSTRAFVSRVERSRTTTKTNCNNGLGSGFTICGKGFTGAVSVTFDQSNGDMVSKVWPTLGCQWTDLAGRLCKSFLLSPAQQDFFDNGGNATVNAWTASTGQAARVSLNADITSTVPKRNPDSIMGFWLEPTSNWVTSCGTSYPKPGEIFEIKMRYDSDSHTDYYNDTNSFNYIDNNSKLRCRSVVRETTYPHTGRGQYSLGLPTSNKQPRIIFNTSQGQPVDNAP